MGHKLNKYMIMFLVIVLYSCSNKKSKLDVALTYWSSNNRQEIEFTEKITEKWNTNNPSKKIFFQPIPEGQSSEEIILAAVVGKTTPDIYANMMQGSVEFYAASEVLVALDTLEGFMPFLRQRCDKKVIEEVTSSDGHIYQIPWKINPIMTLLSKNIYDTLGMDTIPYNYSLFLEASRRFQRDRNSDGHVDQWFGITSVKPIWYQRLFNYYPLYLAASGGAPLIKDNKAFFNNKYSIQVFAFLQELYNREYLSKQQQSAISDPFIGGTVATKFTGPWEISYQEKFKPDYLEFEFIPMPVPDDFRGPVYTYGDPKNIVIFNTCKNPQMAWEFIKTMITPEGDLEFIRTTEQLPRRKGLDTLQLFTDFFKSHPKMKPFAKQSKYVKGIDNCDKITEVLDIISQEYEACVLYNTKTPKVAISDAEKAVNILLRVK